MPQLGETVTEGTITKWYKAVGDQVARDEPLFEVSTDKVDSEVPSPAEGVLTSILVEEGDTVEVGVTLAVIGDECFGQWFCDRGPADLGSAPGPSSAPAPPLPPPVPTLPPRLHHRPLLRLRRRHAAADGCLPPTTPATPHRRPPPRSPGRGAALLERGAGALAGGAAAAHRTPDRPVDRQRNRTGGPDHPERCRAGPSPPGAVWRHRPPRPPASDAPAAPLRSGPSGARAGRARRQRRKPPASTDGRGAPRDEVVPFTNIRRRTAEHMVRSKATSAHTLMVKEIDYERVEQVRRAPRRRLHGRGGLRPQLSPVRGPGCRRGLGRVPPPQLVGRGRRLSSTTTSIWGSPSTSTTRGSSSLSSTTPRSSTCGVWPAGSATWPTGPATSG